MTITLNYPVGEFTHAELAEFNGMEKPAIYLLLKEAVAKGILVQTGTRPTGKRPANLYRVADPNAQVPVPTVVSPPKPTAILVEETPSIPAVEAVQSVASTIPRVEPVQNSAPDAAYSCPFCDGPMTVIPDATGVMVKCFNKPCDPQCHENPFGHGKNAKDAWAISKEKFQKP